MPYKKGGAAQAGANARKRIQRQINNLAKNLKTDASRASKAYTVARINALEEAKAQTYKGRGKNAKSDKDVYKGIEQANRSITAAKTTNANYVTQTELNKASAGLPSQFSQEEASIFYKATSEAWNVEGVSVRDRNIAIMEYYGYSSLDAIVRATLARNQIAVNAAKEAKKRYTSNNRTVEQDEFYNNEDDVKDTPPSPPWFDLIVNMEPLSDVNYAEPAFG